MQEEPRRRSLSINGIKLSILQAGRGDPVIFVHGVVTTSNIFTRYLNANSPDFRGVAVDLRGYGDSEKPATGFTIEHFADDLIAVADALEIACPVWVGVSMGGLILQRLALDHASRVRALVLVSTTDQALIVDDDPATIGAPRDFAQVSEKIITESFPPQTERKTYQPLLDRIPTWNANVLREALTSMRTFSARGKLSAITAPTLIAVGSKDDCTTPAIAKTMQSQLPNSRLVEFDTGHFMMAEDPERFGLVLGQFLRELDGTHRA